MAIQKTFLKSKPICKVTFSVKPENKNEVFLIGDFNDWNPKQSPLKALKNGTYKGTIELETGKEYEFKYLIGNEFVNDTEADTFKYNQFAGSENSVLVL